MIYGILIPVWGKLSLGELSTTGLIGAPSLDHSRCRVSRARNAASHLISSSSDGAQSTNVRFAVTIRNKCSSGDPATLSAVRFDADVASLLRMLNCREGPRGRELSDGASRSESDTSVPDPSGSNSRASSTAVKGMKRTGRASYMSVAIYKARAHHVGFRIGQSLRGEVEPSLSPYFSPSALTSLHQVR